MTKATLNLHGVKHADVDLVVENFALMNESPMKIITGNSNKMKKLVFNVLDRHNINYMILSKNLGEIIIC